ncbi:MAG: amidophosphoribosyltransferase [Bacteroidales bacterium]|nr:amidophosphoribosyltransferase [Bacteroidales bacterium]
MSDQIKHECGIAFLRLRKPLEYYLAKYGTSLWGLNKMHLLMQKQHNRGQDGAGIVNVKIGMPPGHKYISRERSNTDSPLKDIFTRAYQPFLELEKKNATLLNDVNYLKMNHRFTGEVFMGHLRYGTFGINSIDSIHPVLRTNNWKTKNLILSGNFNLTNVNELFDRLVELGQFPTETSDTITMLEKIGHFLDEENEELYRRYKYEGFSKKEITPQIADHLNIKSILQRASSDWDGGYVITGLLGHGDGFILRDPAGIRPAFYYVDEDIVVAASERPVIETSLNVPGEKVRELKPGHALIVKHNNSVEEVQILTPTAPKACTFERIYFSRGTDKDIYKERKKLGALITPAILQAIDYDIRNTVFSYIPNTAAVAFQGLVEELNKFCNQQKTEKVLELGDKLSKETLNEIMLFSPRIETVAVKDMKLRTFITQDQQRDDLVGHVYDITYGSLKAGQDKLVIIDDSIVRGTTLKQSIINILDRLGPTEIIVISSAPQIRYPDCYGIDMARLGDFIAFKAVIELLKESKQESIINEVYLKCKAQEKAPKEEVINYVKAIYKPFTAQQISDKIAQLVTPKQVKAKVSVIFQSIEDLHEALPNHKGDWYFTGDYPTPGGNKVVNTSFINYIEGKVGRAY